MLTLNTAQAPYPQRYSNTQLAANNRAIVNTQLAIDAAYESGANRYVTGEPGQLWLCNRPCSVWLPITVHTPVVTL